MKPDDVLSYTTKTRSFFYITIIQCCVQTDCFTDISVNINFIIINHHLSCLTSKQPHGIYILAHGLSKNVIFEQKKSKL